MPALPGTEIPLLSMSVDRLPDMNTPRSGHHVRLLNGDITVFGGVTSGFTLTKTAEYLHGGKWHPVPMLYNHASSFCMTLSSGKVLLGGGVAEDFGIGQSWGVEEYDPQTHQFSPYTILDKKRAQSKAVELQDGSIVVSGNWYADDGIELYQPRKGFSFVKDVAEPRSYPYILQTAADNAIILCEWDNYGAYTQQIADRLHGDPFKVPLLEDYTMRSSTQIDDQNIGDTSQGIYAHLIPVFGENDDLRIALVKGEDFSLVETDHPIPKTLSGGRIKDNNGLLFFLDKARQLGYLSVPVENEKRYYFFCIDYKNVLIDGTAKLTCFQSDRLPEINIGPFVVLPDGDLVLPGGGPISDGRLNYSPSAAVFRFTPWIPGPKAGEFPRWLIALLIFGIGAMTSWLVFSRKNNTTPEASADSPEEPTLVMEKEMIQKVSALMEEKQLYRQQNLKIVDVAKMLGTNITYISSCINKIHGGTFHDYINRYRVQFAQQWLLEHPERKISEAGDVAGFSSEASFFRNFKAVTGLTPTEWRTKQTPR